MGSNIIRTMIERDWIKIVGHREVPGRPALYSTTNAFLDYFNLERLDQLPTLQEIKGLSVKNDSSESEDSENAVSDLSNEFFAKKEADTIESNQTTSNDLAG